MNSYNYKVIIEANSQEEADEMFYKDKIPAEWIDCFLDYVTNEDGDVWEM